MPFNPANSPRVQFKLIVLVVLLAIVVGSYVILKTTGDLAATAQNASDQAELAQLAAEASDRLRVMSQIVQARIDEAMLTPEITSLTDSQEAATVAWLNAEAQDPPNDRIAELPAPFSLTAAVEFQSAIDFLTNRLAGITGNVESTVLQAGSFQVGQAVERSLDAYFRNPTLGNLRELHVGIKGLLAFTTTESPSLSAEALTLRDDLDSSIEVLRWFVLALGFTGSVVAISLALYMTQTTQRLLNEAQEEQEELANLTRDLEYRNNQMNALYNVFNEITDTLSLRYVVKATLVESLKIMRADMVVLRILRGDELEVAGAMNGAEEEIDGIGPVKLGQGPTGRTAKRGRTLRIDKGGEGLMAPDDDEEDEEGERDPGKLQGPLLGNPLEAGLIVPLIVGARVVGTLSCWSRQTHAFSEGDERILEMMASQVATAIVAADTTEKSESRAMHDPLTSLPNRRQLDEDIAGKLQTLVDEGRSAVVAMIDIDHFKRFNDEYGHRAGDITLQKVAAVLRKSARDDDLVYRYGGEEFVVVLTDTQPEDVLPMAERLRIAVETAPIGGQDFEPMEPLTVSIGLALLPQHGTDLNELIGLADKAMYGAKANGRNRVELWDSVEEHAA